MAVTIPTAGTMTLAITIAARLKTKIRFVSISVFQVVTFAQPIDDVFPFKFVQVGLTVFAAFSVAVAGLFA